jgi:VanZ family protein
LGVAAFLAVARRYGHAVGLLFAVLFGTTLSACIEMLQVYDQYRSCSPADWLCNTLGALAGAVLAMVFGSRLTAIMSSVGRRGAPAGLLLAVCWAGAQLYPLIPQLSRGHLRFAWAHFLATPVSWVTVFVGAAGWFVFALALRAVWGRLASGWLALAMLAIPARLFIADRAPAKSDILAGALALLLWAITSDHVRQGAAWLLLMAAIVLRELAPFHFTSAAHAFSWKPFAATIGADPAPSIEVILHKAFEYGAMVWLLRTGGIGYITGGVMVAAALAVMEALQCFMPGRQAEITDSVLALIMALTLRLLDFRGGERVARKR